MGRLSAHRIEVNVPAQPAAGITVDAHVDDCRARLDHVGADQGRSAGRGNQDVGLPTQAPEHLLISGTVAYAYRRAGIDKHVTDRPADNQAATDHRRLPAARINAGRGNQAHDPQRRAGFQAGVQTGSQRPQIGRMKAVDVLVRIDCHDCAPDIYLRRQRLLHQYPVNFRIAVEFPDAIKQLILGNVGRQPHDSPLDSQFPACLLLAPHIQAGGRIIPHQHESQTGGGAALGQHRGNASLAFVVDTLGNRITTQ